LWALCYSTGLVSNASSDTVERVIIGVPKHVGRDSLKGDAHLNLGPKQHEDGNVESCGIASLDAETHTLLDELHHHSCAAVYRL